MWSYARHVHGREGGFFSERFLIAHSAGLGVDSPTLGLIGNVSSSPQIPQPIRSTATPDAFASSLMTESNPSPKIPARVRSRTISATCSTTRLIDRIVLEQISQKGKRESTALTGVTVGDCKPIENQLIEGLQDLAPERAVSDSWQERNQARNYRQRLGDEERLIGAATLIAENARWADP